MMTMTSSTKYLEQPLIVVAQEQEDQDPEQQDQGYPSFDEVKNSSKGSRTAITASGEEEEDEDDDEEAPFFDEDDVRRGSLVGKVLVFKQPKRRRRLLLIVVVMIIIIMTALSLLSLFSFSFSNNKNLLFLHQKSSPPQVDHGILWRQTFPFLTIESALRVVVNNNNNNNQSLVMIPFGTLVDASFYDAGQECAQYFPPKEDSRSNHDDGCGGGLLALDVATGQVKWSLLTLHELFAINCDLDITEDGVKDCIVGGRMSGILAVDSTNGRILWSIPPSSFNPTSNYYTPLFIDRDVDGDGISDVILINGGDPLRKARDKTRMTSHILLVSSVSGRVLMHAPFPDNNESYYSPTKLVGVDGEVRVLIGSGGETRGGSLMLFSLDDWLRSRRLQVKTILQNDSKGFMTPPILADVTGDGIRDVIFNLFDSSVVCLDGVSLRVLWRQNFPGSESYSSPAIGRFFASDKSYLLIQRSFGPGFPIYTHAQTLLLDSATGKVVKRLDASLIGVQSSPLVVNAQEGDYFVFWRATCFSDNDTEIDWNSGQDYLRFREGTSVHEASRADFCRLRFNGRLVSQLIVQNNGSKTIVYDSRDHPEEESPLQQQPMKRHVGVHAAVQGVQRIISTPAIVAAADDGISIVFGVFWFKAPSHLRLQSPEVTSCIERYSSPEVEERVRLRGQGLDLDHDAFEAAVLDICLGHEEESTQPPSTLKEGSLSVFRVALDSSTRFLDHRSQTWREYLGNEGDSIVFH
jgi:hypothetical protein